MFSTRYTVPTQKMFSMFCAQKEERDSKRSGERMWRCLKWEVAIPALGAKWACSRYSMSASPPLSPPEPNLG